MKKTILLIIFTFSMIVMNAQNIGGVWQFNSPYAINGEMYYSFDSDNRQDFEFRTNTYDGLKRIYYLRGSYSINKDSIYFTLETIEEYLGGKIIREINRTNSRSEMEHCLDSTGNVYYRQYPSTSNHWKLTTSPSRKWQTTTLTTPETFSASFKHYRDEKGHEIIEIDGDKFYLLPEP